MAEQRGLLDMIVVDNGPSSRATRWTPWAYRRGAQLHFIRPGKPIDNSFVDRKFRGSCLNENWFVDLRDTRTKIEAWRREYNEVRPHSALGQTHRQDTPPGSRIASPVEPRLPERLVAIRAEGPQVTPEKSVQAVIYRVWLKLNVGGGANGR